MTLLRSPIHGPIRSLIYSPLAGKWGLAYDASLFGPSDDGLLYNFWNTSLLFQNSNGTTPVAADADPIGWAKSPVAAQRIATQATTSARPLWKTPNTARFDGSAAFLLTTFAGGTVRTLAGKFKGSAATGAVIGLTGQRLYLALGNSGELAGGVGNDSVSVIKGGADIRNQIHVGVLTTDGVTNRLYLDGAQVYSGAVNGTVGAVAMMIGAANSGGSPVQLWNGDIYNALAINRALTPTSQTTGTRSDW